MSFDLYLPGEEELPLDEHKPVYRLVHDSKQSSWELRCARCPECRYQRHVSRSPKSEDTRTLLRVHQEVVTVGDRGARVPALHVDMPLDGAWCEACSNRRQVLGKSSATAPAVKLTTRLPKWSARLKAPTLDFGGRCKVSSVRNFQMTSNSSGQCAFEDVAFMFGKLDSELFLVEFKGVLSPVQAFALALTTSSWPGM